MRAYSQTDRDMLARCKFQYDGPKSELLLVY